MKAVCLFLALGVAAAAGPSTLSFADNQNSKCSITYVNKALASQCDLSTSASCSVASSCADIQALQAENAATSMKLAAQAAENAALRKLISELTTRVTASERAHNADVQALLDAESAYKAADAALSQDIAAVTKMQGPKGDKGDVGVTGAVGAKGERGAQGLAGADGADGADGVNGVDGADGADGAKGDRGAVGAAGKDGTDGADGANGQNGAKGDKGEKGDKGSAGARGANGSNGSNGSPGAKGQKGEQGQTPVKAETCGIFTSPSYSTNGLHGDCATPAYFTTRINRYQSEGQRYQSSACLNQLNNGWIQEDLGAVRKVTQIHTGGRPAVGQLVTSYSISVSQDGSNWTNAGTYSGNSNDSTIVTRTLSTPQNARYVRLYVRSYSGYASIRMDVTTCQ